MKLVTVHLPQEFIVGLDDLVRQRRYPNRSEAIRIAIRDLLKEELWVRASSVRQDPVGPIDDIPSTLIGFTDS